MKNLFLTGFALLFLTACPSEKEVKEMTETLLEKKTSAETAITSNDFGLESLLKMHDYFFDFSEKIHLMKEDPKAKDNIKSLIKKNGMNAFCRNFIISTRLWEQLDQFCKQESTYKCSLDIKDYPTVQKVFLGLIGPEMEKQFKSEKECQ